MKKWNGFFIATLLVSFISLTVSAQIVIGSGGVPLGTAYTQNFNSLANTGASNTWANNTTIAGWYSNRTTYIAANGSDNTGALYSFGSTGSSERALGSIPSNTTDDIFYGVRMKNNTGAEIRSFTISYTGEQWRAANNNTQTLVFGYFVGSTVTDVSGAGYTENSTGLNFISPTTGNSGALDPPSQLARSDVLNIQVPNGSEIMFRWKDVNDNANDHGLAIDNVSITAWPEDNGLPVELSAFTAVAGDGHVTLHWATESEINNMQFDILRAPEQQGEYVLIGSREGQFNTNQRTEYTFTDDNVVNGTTYWYKLEDVDINGLRTEHGPISATPGLPEDVVADQFKLLQNYPNPFNPVTTLQVYVPGNAGATSSVKVEIYNLLGQKVITLFDGNLAAGLHPLTWNGDSDRGAAVAGGIYFAILRAGTFQDHIKLALLK